MSGDFSGIVAAMGFEAQRAVIYLTPNGLGNPWIPAQIHGLRERDVPVELHALHELDQDFHGSEALEALRRETRLVYPVSRLAVAADAVLAPFRFGRRFWRALGYALTPGEPTSLGDRLRLVLQLFVAVHWARKLGPRAAHVHAEMAHSPASIGMLAAELLGVGFSFTGHANDLFQRRVALRRKLARADFVHCISRFHRALYLREGAREEQTELAYLGTEVERFASVSPFEPGPGEEPVVLSAGRLVARKGFHVLLDACALLRKRGVAFRLAIAGSGPELAALTRRAEEAGLAETAQLSGEALLQAELPAFLGTGTVFCLACLRAPDGDMDGLPLMLVEAMAAGLPCVSTRLVGIPDLIAHGESGLLAKPGDAVDLADQLERLLRDPALRDRLGRRSRDEIRARFDQDRLLDRLAVLFGARLGREGGA